MPKFRIPDQDSLCEFIIEEKNKRCEDRKHLEKLWKDIDRQLRMEPDLSHKKDHNGRDIPQNAWMPETELPLQSQTLEITTADARRFLSPDTGMWFAAHVALTDEYLDKVDIQSMITGDENDVPSKITQDNADKLAAGIVDHWHSQYDFWGNIDQIVSESIKYSMGVGRARMVNTRVFNHTNQGVVVREQTIPMLVPRSIKDTYLDNSKHNLNNEGYHVGPATIFKKSQKLKDVRIAANRGGADQGWLTGNLRDIEGDDWDNVELIEWEGDIIVPRKSTESFYLPNGLFTVLLGKKDKKTAYRLIRARKNPFPTSSIIEVPYHKEHLDSAYATSPLMKGHPIQVAAVSALNRLIEAGALNTQPPVQYDSDDQSFAGDRGPRVYPGAQWGSTGEIKTHQIGDVTGLSAVYTQLLMHYADVTGVNAPRLGAQTISHTTAYAKEAELARGQVRTLDFVKSTLKGPLTRWLDIAYEMGLKNLSETDVYLQPYQGYVTLRKELLPKEVQFEAFGAAGPQEETMKWQKKLNAVQMAIQMDQLNIQLQMATGQPPSPVLDMRQIIEQILREGNWTDVDTITNSQTAAGQAPGAGGIPGIDGVNPGTTSTVLQNLAYGGR